MSSKIEELKATYMKDVQLAASKSKFGFFSVLPSVSAGDQSFQPKKIEKDQNGKVKTQERNIFSGLCASGVLKKSFFMYTPSYKPGDVYQDPGRADRQQQMKTAQKFKDHDPFKCVSLNKTITRAAYEYVPQKQLKKDPKCLKDENGKVKVHPPNMATSPTSKIQFKNMTNLKYVSDPYENPKLIKRKQLLEDIAKRGEGAFKPASPIKNYFSSFKQQFGKVDVPQKKQKKIQLNIQQHDTSFRPSGPHYNDGSFSYPEYMPIGNGKQQPKKIQKNQGEKKQPFRLIKRQKNSRPCPSVSFSKMNLLRSFR